MKLRHHRGGEQTNGRSQQPVLGWSGFTFDKTWGGKEGKPKSVFIDIKIHTKHFAERRKTKIRLPRWMLLTVKNCHAHQEHANSWGLPACCSLSYTWVVLPSETACVIFWVTFFNLTKSRLLFRFLKAVLKTNTEVILISLWLDVNIELSQHRVLQTEHRFSLSPPPTRSTSTVFMHLSKVPTWWSCNAQARRREMNELDNVHCWL